MLQLSSWRMFLLTISCRLLSVSLGVMDCNKPASSFNVRVDIFLLVTASGIQQKYCVSSLFLRSGCLVLRQERKLLQGE